MQVVAFIAFSGVPHCGRSGPRGSLLKKDQCSAARQRSSQEERAPSFYIHFMFLYNGLSAFKLL
jgi:hypothetical protein